MAQRPSNLEWALGHMQSRSYRKERGESELLLSLCDSRRETGRKELSERTVNKRTEETDTSRKTLHRRHQPDLFEHKATPLC